MASLRTLTALTHTLADYGDRPALLAFQREGQTRWTYAELAERVEQLAAGLQAAGLEPGTPAALVANNRPEWVAACLAIIRVGAIVVPVDVQAGDEMLAHILADSQARFIFTTSDQLPQLDRLELETDPTLILFDGQPAEEERHWHHWLAESSQKMPTPESDDTAILFYTSGTTGAPKGVPLTQANVTFQLQAIVDARIVTETDRVLLSLPLHHVYPFVFGMLTPLLLGLLIVMPHTLTGPQLVRALQEGRVTLIIGVPRLYRALVDGLESRARSGGWLAATFFRASLGLSLALRRWLGLRLGKQLLKPLHQRFGPELRVVASGGSALDPALAWKLEALGWQVAIGYGLTETAPLLTLNPPGQARLDSAGRPLEGLELRLDPSARPDQSQTEGPQQGEILAKGPNVFSGYRHLPEKTEEVFTTDGWFRTGDLGFFDEDGFLHVTGRVSTMIVTESGENIQPEDVEEAYLKSPVIGEIAVLEQEGKLVAIIVPDLNQISQQKESKVEQAVRQAVNERSRQLPSYQRLSDYALTRDPLPRTRLGKPRRHLLPERYEQAKAGEEGAESQGPMPLNQMSDRDQALLEDPTARQLWDWLAERYADRRLTPNTSPQLDLGVDSLEWLNLTLEIRERVGVELDEEAIGRIETIRDLLQEVTEASHAAEAPADSVPLDDPESALSPDQRQWLAPLSPFQRFLTRWMYRLNRFLMRHLFQLRVEGREHLPAEGPFIITPNHVSYLDPPAVAAALSDDRLAETYWAGARAVVFFNPILRLVSRLSHTVPVDTARTSLAFGAAILQRDKSLVWFPEGRRTPDGQLDPFRPGVGILLKRLPVPVVPTYIHGTFQAHPVGNFWPRFRPVTIAFGPPLEPGKLQEQGSGDQPYERIVQALRHQVANLGRQFEETEEISE